MNIFEFMCESPVLSFFLAVIMGEVIIRVLIKLPNRILRHRNILKHGYPPEHCDADGDFKEEQDSD